MKTPLLIAAAAGALIAAPAAFAQTAPGTITGTVGITGSVAPRCIVIDGSSTTFSDTIILGELTQTNGTLRTDLQGAVPVSAAVKQFQVVCNSSDATVTLDADQFSAGLGTPPAGYSGTINYTAELDALLSPSGSKVVTHTTPNTATSDTLGGALLNTAGNLTVKAFNFTTVGGNSLLLQAGAYTGAIHVTIAPSS